MRRLSPKLLLACFCLLSLACADLLSVDIEEDMNFRDYMDDYSQDDGFNMEDFDFMNLEVQDLDAHNLRDMALERGLLLVLYLDQTTSEKSEQYEKFFKTIGPFITSEALDLDITLGRIIVEKTTNLPTYYEPPSYPSIILYDYQRKFVYDQTLELVDFFSWIASIAIRELVQITDKEGLKEFIESDNSHKVVAFYDSMIDSSEFEALNDLFQHNYLTALDIRKVAICAKDCPAEYNGHVFKRPSLALFRSLEDAEPVVVLENDLTDMEAVHQFCSRETLPLVLIFDEANMTKMFEDVFKGQLILILDPNVDNTDVINEFTKSAKYNKEHDPKEERFVHAIYYYVDNENDGIQAFFNVKKTTRLPKLFLTETSNELQKILKYENTISSPLTFEVIREFLRDFSNKVLSRFYISEDVPSQDGLVKKLVGSVYQSEVIDSETHYAVFVCYDYAEDICKEGLTEFENVAQTALTTWNAPEIHLKFGYIDISKNEVDFDLSGGFPLIHLYRNDRKTQPISYPTPKFNEQEMLNWIKEWISEFSFDSAKAEALAREKTVRQTIEL